MAQSVEDKAKKPAPKKRAAPKPKRKRGGRLTQKAELERQQKIVGMRDGDLWPWSAIALELETSESAVREAYYRYTNDIAPLIRGERPTTVAYSYLRMFEHQRRKLAEIASGGAKESVQVQARREIVGVIQREIELRQNLGLLPKDLGKLAAIEDVYTFIEQALAIMRREGVSKVAMEELAAILAGERPVIEGTAVAVPTLESG